MTEPTATGWSVQDEFDRVSPHNWDGSGEYRVVLRQKERLIFEVQRTCDCGKWDSPHWHRRLAWPWIKTYDVEFYPVFK